MSIRIRIRDVVEADLDALVAINNLAYPAVPVTPRDELAALRAAAASAVVADDGSAAGFIIALGEGLGPTGENYDWFAARYQRFSYVDRVVVAERGRGAGIGRALYRRVLEDAVAAGRDTLLCEVNLDPPNPGSLRFHGRLGFEEVGRQRTKGGSVEVVMLAVPVADALLALKELDALAEPATP